MAKAIQKGRRLIRLQSILGVTFKEGASFAQTVLQNGTLLIVQKQHFN